MRRVVITGLGIVSCLGNDKETVSAKPVRWSWRSPTAPWVSMVARSTVPKACGSACSLPPTVS